MITNSLSDSYGDYPQFAAVKQSEELMSSDPEPRTVPDQSSWNDIWNDGLDSKVKPAGHKYLESHISDLPFQKDFQKEVWIKIHKIILAQSFKIARI